MIKNLFILISITFIFQCNLFAKSLFLKEGINLYNNKKFEDAKFKFQQDIVFNPKSELAYLYLSKIFNKQEKKKFRRTKFKNCNVIKSRK